MARSSSYFNPDVKLLFSSTLTRRVNLDTDWILHVESGLKLHFDSDKKLHSVLLELVLEIVAPCSVVLPFFLSSRFMGLDQIVTNCCSTGTTTKIFCDIRK
jgi:hypothetical protein